MTRVNNKITAYNSRIHPVLLSTMVIVCTSLIFSIYLSNFISFNSNAMALVTNNNTFSSSNVGNSGGLNMYHNDIPTAKSVFDTGKMVLPSSVKGFIINLPDETHHPDTDNLIISPANAHYLPSDLVIPSGTSIAFVHGDPNHVHSEVVTAEQW